MKHVCIRVSNGTSMLVSNTGNPNEGEANKILTFSWNTVGVSQGNFTISAYATPASSEADARIQHVHRPYSTVAKAGDLDGFD